MRTTFSQIEDTLNLMINRFFRIENLLKELRENGMEDHDGSAFTTNIKGIRVNLKRDQSQRGFYLEIGNHATFSFGHKITKLIIHQSDHVTEHVFPIEDNLEHPKYMSYLKREDVNAFQKFVEAFYLFMVDKIHELKKIVVEMNQEKSPELQKALMEIHTIVEKEGGDFDGDIYRKIVPSSLYGVDGKRIELKTGNVENLFEAIELALKYQNIGDVKLFGRDKDIDIGVEATENRKRLWIYDQKIGDSKYALQLDRHEHANTNQSEPEVEVYYRAYLLENSGVGYIPYDMPIGVVMNSTTIIRIENILMEKRYMSNGREGMVHVLELSEIAKNRSLGLYNDQIMAIRIDDGNRRRGIAHRERE